MAESYRGLTIRIGGDTTKLTQALKTANQAISGTASDLKRLSAAMKLDPGNFEAATLQVGALASQASNTAAKIVQLRTAMQQTGDLKFTDVDGQVKSVEEMADAFRDVRMEAALAMDAYNSVTTSIAEVDHSVTSLMQNAVRLKSVDLKSALTFDRTSLETAGLDIEKIRQTFESLPSYVKVSETEISNYINRMVELKKQFDEATKVSDKNSILKEMNELGKAMADFQMPVFNFEENTNEVETIRAALEQLAKDDTLDESMRMSQTQIDATCDKLDTLKQTWVEAQARMEVTRTVAQFVDLRAETVKTEASMSAFLDELVKASSTSTVAKGLGETTKQIAELDERYKSAKESVSRINEALKSDPKNVELLAARTRAVADAQELAAEKATLLKQKIDAYQSERVKQLAADTKELASQITITTENFRNSASALSTYEAMIAAVTQRINQLKGNGQTNTQEYKDLIEQLGLLREAGDRARESLKSAIDAMQEPLEANELRALTADFETLGVEAKNIGEVDATPKIDEAAFMQSVNMITNAMRRLSGEIISSSDTIDSAYRDMRKTVNGTEDEFESLLNAAIKFSQTSITSADTMLEMQALGGQLGVLTEDLEQFGRITSSLDIATDMDAEDIALRLGQVANVLSLDIDGMQGFSDALVRLGNNMPAQESAIMNVAQRLSAVASTANFSGAEILAWSAAIASTGQRSEAAATAIGNTISGIESAVAEGGDDIQAFATVAGRSSEDFVKAWKESPTDALRAFLEGLQNINSQGESAVAALENMGITGVRQQQTLLGLSKTVGSLDKALEISEDAWNGVTDQWGQAGDAANEAEKKSAGFSGALAIMQNNASNLAASLGDGFIPAMKIASDVMRIITDVLNEMPAPMKTAIVSIGGIATVLGTVVPVVGQFSKGWAAAAQAAVDSGGSLGGLVAKLTGLEASMVSAGEAAGTLSIGMTALGTVGIAAFVTALTFAVSSIADAIEKQQELEAATTGLESAMSNSSVAYEAYSTGAEGAATSTRDLISETDELISKQAELAQQMTDMWGEIGTKEAVLDSYVQRILQLSDQLTLTKEEQAELNAAVEAFNDTTGSNLEIVNEVTGSLSKSSEEIENIASAWRKTTESNGAMEQYLATTKQLAEDTAELERIEAQLGDTSSNATGWFVDMRNSAGSLDGEYMNLASKADMLRSSIESASAAQQQAISMMSASEVSVAELKAAIEASGYSLSAYASVTAAQWSHIASVYGTNVTKAIEELNRLAKAQGTALSSSTAYTPSIPSSSGSSNSAAKKALQRENDAAYKAQQKAYDAEYKALQKALNKKYNAEKKNLDAIYKERKKQYDAQLKQLKDAQDDEVEAFNKATDAKLKEMEREYKARVKALEEQYGLNDIDEQIEALEAETEAEKRALEERKQQEKVAELKAAVDKAKSRRKRAEAEKKLNDYLEEIGVKHNEQTRKDQIEALKKQKEDLKDELAARKEELKAQYDAEVEAYKDARAQELDALKEANQAEYDAQKEKYDNLLAQLKERQTEQLEALKESQTAQLEALKDSQQAALQAMKDAQQDAVDALSEGTGEVGAVLENAEEDALRKLEEALAKAREEMDAKIPDIKDKFRELVGNVAEETSKIPVNMQQHAQEGTKNLQDVLGNSIQPTRGKADELRAALDNGLSPIPGNFDTYGRNATTNLRNQVDGSVGPTGRSAQQLADAVNMPIDQLQNMIPPEVLSAMGALSDGISHGGRMAEYNADNVASNINGSFSGLGGGQSYMWGYDFLSNFNSGLVSVWNNNLFPNIQTIANTITAWLGHSVPDKGPLQNDDEWGADFVMNLVNGMHDKESDLYKQVKKMAEIVEDGFDPELSLDAAYEAVGGIRGKANRQVQSVAGAGTTINMTMNLDLSNVSFRNEQDIDRFADEVSKRMAAAAARQMAGRL